MHGQQKEEASSKKTKKSTRAEQKPAVSGGRKLSYNEQREYDGMEESILAAEEAVEALKARTEDPDVIADHVAAAKLYEQLSEAERTVKALYTRWAELETVQKPQTGPSGSTA